MGLKNSPIERLWDQIPAAILLVDGEGTILQANRAADEMLGRPSPPPAGERLGTYLSPDEAALLAEKLARILTEGTPAELELRLRRGAQPGPFVGMGMSRARVEQEHVLILARDLGTLRLGRRYRDILDRAPEPVLITRPGTGEFVDSNPALERLLGQSREAMRARGTSPVPVPATPPEGGEMARAPEVAVRTEGGRLLRLETRTGVYTIDGEPFLVTFVRDVTAIHAAERRYQQVFRQSFDPIVVADRASQRVVDANPSFEALSEYTLDELRELVPERLWETADGPWGEGWSGKPEKGTRKAVLRTRTGGRVPVALRWSRLDLGEQGALMLAVHDLRPELKADELERSLALMQRSQALGQMASGIAHDFNNTLMAALPWADLLRRKYPDDETIQKATEQIRRGVQRAKDVTRQLLDFAQPRRPEKSRTSLAALVRQQLKMIRPAIPPEIAIEVALEDPAWVDVDPAQIGQVLLNLALNARDAMPEGGEIRIGVRRPTGTEAERWGVEADRAAVLSVADTGPGIAEHDLESIFNPFFTTKDIGQGAGLGLPVALRIVEQHGGAIYVETSRESGTIFHVVLPAAAEAAVRESAPAPPVRGGGRFEGMRIWIADDEEVVLEGVRALLELEGALVAGFSRAEQMLAALGSSPPPDLIVLDLGMPGIGGGEAHRRIRERHRDLPVLISTGYGDSDRLEGLLEDGRTLYRQKPYDSDGLVAAVEELLSAR